MLLSNIVKRIKMAIQRAFASEANEIHNEEKGRPTPVPRVKNVGGFVWVPNKIRKRMGRV